MTSTILRNALTAAAALTLAVTSLSAPGFAKDGDKRGTFQILVPKSDRGGSGQIATSQFVAPKAKKSGGQVFTTQFVAPKADRGNGGSAPVLFRLTPKATLAGSGPSGGIATAKFVAPKATREDAPVLASAETPKPLLLAPVTASPVAVVKAGAAAPAETSTADTETSTAEAEPTVAATGGQVALAYFRAAEHYGYGEGAEDDQSDDGSYADGAYEAGYSAYDGEAYSGDDCQ